MQGHRGGAFNLGTGSGLSVREILTAIAAETGRIVPHVVKPRRQGNPTCLVAAPTAARETRQFTPAHSDLATIIRTAWAWHRKTHPVKAAEPVGGGLTANLVATYLLQERCALTRRTHAVARLAPRQPHRLAWVRNNKPAVRGPRPKRRKS